MSICARYTSLLSAGLPKAVERGVVVDVGRSGNWEHEEAGWLNSSDRMGIVFVGFVRFHLD